MLKYKRYQNKNKEKNMKKLMLVALSFFALFAFTGCYSNDILANTAKDYYATGNWQTPSWGGVTGDATKKMTAIAMSDERLDGLQKTLKGATAIYVYELVLPAELAGWPASIWADGVETVVDGNLCVKVIRTAAGDGDTIDFWAQSPESGLITNLTPSTLYIPEFVETADGNGAWNDNPVARAAGKYWLIYAEVGTAKFMGLVAR
jgi:hypothetical protein